MLCFLFVTYGRDSPKVGWVTNRGQLGWKLGVQQVSQYVTVDCVYYTGATNLQDVIALVHPSCACPPRGCSILVCVMDVAVCDYALYRQLKDCPFPRDMESGGRSGAGRWRVF